MKFRKMIVAAVLFFAMFLTVVPTTKVNAAVKLNKKKVTVNAGKSVSLKLSGAKNVTWKSSDKTVATVTKKGKVTGVKAGTAKIVATNKTTKKKYTCIVTVKEIKKEFGYKEDSFSCLGDASGFRYVGELVPDCSYYIDGQALNNNEVSTDEEGKSYVIFNEPVSEGKHTLKITKDGYNDYEWSFTYKAPSFDGLIGSFEPFARDNTLYIALNPAVKDIVKITFGLEEEVEPFDSFISGDGDYILWIDITDVQQDQGTHVYISAEGYETKEYIFMHVPFDVLISGSPYIGNVKGTEYLFCSLNKYAEGQATILIDGVEVTPAKSFVNGDGVYANWIETENLAPGEHTVEVRATGFETETRTFTK
jgi:hypothetical protein